MINFDLDTKYKIEFSNKFKKQLKKMLKQDKDIKKLLVVITMLANKEPLDIKYKDHQLIDDKSVITDYYNKPDGSADFGNLHFCINNVSCTININEGKFPTTRKSIFKLVELYNRMKKINIEPNIAPKTKRIGLFKIIP